MARSRRKAPVAGHTTAISEKEDKRAYNRRYRHVAKQAVGVGDEEKPLPDLREHSDPWGMDKDGKGRFDPETYPEGMRK